MTESDLQKFFLSRLAPLQSVVSPFVSADIDRSRESYFEQVFEPEPVIRHEETVASLVAIWRRLGLDALVMLEPDIRRIAKELRAPQAQAADVSGFVYAMY